MGGGEETKTGEEENQKKTKTGEEENQKKKSTPSDLNDYIVIKEGEVEILMHTKNEVFYNKTQVNNRDMSIVVLMTFISKRKEEHEALLSNGKSNGECEEMPHDESNDTCEEPEKTREGKGRGELKPPRVLEALSASGLRALRYAREIEGIGQVVALDNDKEAVEACRRNIKFNGSVAGGIKPC